MKKPDFNSDAQRNAMHFISVQTDDVLYFDQTGRGKSGVVFGPDIAEKGVTIVVVPLYPILKDIKWEPTVIDVPKKFGELEDVLDRVPYQGIVFGSPEDVFFRQE